MTHVIREFWIVGIWGAMPGRGRLPAKRLLLNDTYGEAGMVRTRQFLQSGDARDYLRERPDLTIGPVGLWRVQERQSASSGRNYILTPEGAGLGAVV